VTKRGFTQHAILSGPVLCAGSCSMHMYMMSSRQCIRSLHDLFQSQSTMHSTRQQVQTRSSAHNPVYALHVRIVDAGIVSAGAAQVAHRADCPRA
jgi:hypothetical protein